LLAALSDERGARGCTVTDQGHREAADQDENAAGGFENNNVACGLATGLKDLGLREEDIGGAVDVVAKRKFPNPRPVAAADIDNVIRQAFAGKPPRF
jgi:hypothetical protein